MFVKECVYIFGEQIAKYLICKLHLFQTFHIYLMIAVILSAWDQISLIRDGSWLIDIKIIKDKSERRRERERERE